jgi:hypothetical protein
MIFSSSQFTLDFIAVVKLNGRITIMGSNSLVQRFSPSAPNDTLVKDLELFFNTFSPQLIEK